MAINVSVQHNGGFLSDILLLTQAPIFVWFDGTVIVYYYYHFNYVRDCLQVCFVWWPCMAMNVSVQYNGGLLPDIILFKEKIRPHLDLLSIPRLWGEKCQNV